MRCLKALKALLAVVLVLATSPRKAHALYGGDSKVKVLTARNFQSAVIDSDVPAMVEFFAPWVSAAHARWKGPVPAATVARQTGCPHIAIA